MEADEPEGELVKEKMKEFSKKWRLYCNRLKFTAKSYPLLDEYMNGVIDQYRITSTE
jgi:hypothetical protein